MHLTNIINNLGKYYPGKISRDRGDGTYDVDYDDGEKETSVEEKLIRPLGRAKGGEPSPRKLSRFEEGGRVEADYRGKGKYYPGKISRDRGDGTYDVDYDDGEKETRVEEKMIRLLAKNTIVPVASTALVQAVSAGTTALQVNPSIYEYHMTPHILHSIQL